MGADVVGGLGEVVDGMVGESRIDQVPGVVRVTMPTTLLMFPRYTGHQTRREALDALTKAGFGVPELLPALTVVTRNTAEFRNTGVETVDPWAAA